MIKEKTLVTIKEDIQIEYPFSDDLPMIFLGEITNMPEHGNPEKAISDIM